MPDITSNVNAEIPSSLQWVGMEQIAVPISIKQSNGSLLKIAAKANVFVSLDSPQSKGIHMSRAHLAINKLANTTFEKKSINALLEELVSSQGSISQQAKIDIAFDLMLQKPALLSAEYGFQSYPITVRAEKNNHGTQYQFEITIPYSSTCPCSASLARQLYAQAIDKTFPESTVDKEELLAWAQSQAGTVATPHSQRSYAYICLTLNDEWPDLSSLIFQFEKVIGTPVQTAVKRSDEQEFARLNANNMMFCEDAARRIKKALEQITFIKDYWFKVKHQESLHAHNAVVIDQKLKS